MKVIYDDDEFERSKRNQYMNTREYLVNAVIGAESCDDFAPSVINPSKFSAIQYKGTVLGLQDDSDVLTYEILPMALDLPKGCMHDAIEIVKGGSLLSLIIKMSEMPWDNLPVFSSLGQSN